MSELQFVKMHMEELFKGIEQFMIKDDMQRLKADLGDTDQSTSSASSDYVEYKPADAWEGPRKSFSCFPRSCWDSRY